MNDRIKFDLLAEIVPGITLKHVRNAFAKRRLNDLGHDTFNAILDVAYAEALNKFFTKHIGRKLNKGEVKRVANHSSQYPDEVGKSLLSLLGTDRVRASRLRTPMRRGAWDGKILEILVDRKILWRDGKQMWSSTYRRGSHWDYLFDSKAMERFSYVKGNELVRRAISAAIAFNEEKEFVYVTKMSLGGSLLAQSGLVGDVDIFVEVGWPKMTNDEFIQACSDFSDSHGRKSNTHTQNMDFARYYPLRMIQKISPRISCAGHHTIDHFVDLGEPSLVIYDREDQSIASTAFEYFVSKTRAIA